MITDKKLLHRFHPRSQKILQRYENLIGREFNKLTVLAEAATYRAPSGYRKIRWLCLCQCGNEVTVRGDHLRNGNTTSCGCALLLISTVHGMNGTPEYDAYRNAGQRCNDPNATGFHNYGGAGVKFRFNSFDEFFSELGLRPSPKHSVDRINPFGHYEKGNVRWATAKEQNNNQRRHFLRQSLP